MGKVKQMTMNTFPTQGPSLSLKVETFQRAQTYGQILGSKALVRLVKKLGVARGLADMVYNQIGYGSPGSPDTYRVRIRWHE